MGAKQSWILALCLCLQHLSGCGSSAQGAVAPPAAAGPIAIDGHFVGKVTIDGEDYFADVVFNDGAAQLHIGDRVSSASVSVAAATDGDPGTIRGETDESEETWTLDLTP
jgi:hypothetical protein